MISEELFNVFMQSDITNNEPFDSNNCYELTEVNSVDNDVFKYYSKNYKLIFKNLPKEYERIIATIEDVFDSIIDSVSEPQDYIFFQINHDSFEQGVLTIPCETAAKLHGSKILYEITRVLNSNTELDVTKY